MTAAETYARWVLSPENERRTGRYIKLAAQRFLNDLERKDIYFDDVKAAECGVYCERYLCLWEDKWRGKPMDFKPWMEFIFQQIFGWIRVDTGLRRFKKAFVEVAKKNAKSTMAGGLINFHLTADQNVSTPSIFIGANNEDQAKICLKIAGKIIENSPAFDEWLEDQDIQLFYNYGEINKIVLHPDPSRDNREGTVVALSKEGSDKKSKTSGGKHGKNPSLIVIDEYGMASDDNQLNDMESGQAARDEPLLFVITTAGFNMDGPCYSKFRKTGIGVLEGTMEDDSFLVIIYELDKPIDAEGKQTEITIQYLLDNEEVWEQCNPNIDISVSRDFLRSRLRTARNEGGTKEVDVMTLNFNRWMFSPEVFIQSEVWNRNVHGLEVEDGEECYGGIEIGPSGAISAMCLLFPGEIVKIKMLFFIAEEALKLNEFYRMNKQYIKVDPGNEVENSVAIEWILEEFQRYNLDSFCFPVTHKNNSIVQELIQAGYEGNPISQGMSGISNATLEYEKALKAEQVEHFGNPVLTWHNSNCLAIQKEAGTRIEKNSKVLGVYAVLNAWAQWLTKKATETDDKLIQSW